jgi:hypothetical protein
MKKRNTRSAVLYLLAAVLFAGAGVFAYANDYILVLFGLIPLNGVAFGVIAVLMLAVSIYQLVKAPQKDQEEAEVVQQQVSASQQTAAAATPLSSPCAINITHIKGSVGLVNKLTVVLNGAEIGELKNKKSLNLGTGVSENVLMIIHSGTNGTGSLAFSATAGGVVNLSVSLDLLGQIIIEQV